LVSLLGPIRPYLVQYIIDNVYPTKDYSLLLFYTLVLLGLLVFTSIVQYAQNYITNWLSQTIMKDLRDRVFRHIIHLKIQFFDKTPIGNLHTRTINDVQTLNDVFSQGFVSIFGELLQLIAIWGMMFYTDWYLTLIVLITLPLIIIVTQIFRKNVKVAFQEVRKKVAELNSFIQEHITGMNIIQWFGQEENEFKKFIKINAGHRDENIKTIFYYSVYFPAIEIISAMGVGLLVWIGASEVIEDRVSLGVLIAFIMYIHMFFRPIRLIADQFNTIQMGIVSGERIFNLLDTKDFIHQSESLISNDQATKILSYPPSIEFVDVHFEYQPNHPILRGISFFVEPGTTTAIVGHTGAGKTSIINLLTRFYEFQKGQILINQQDIRKFPLNILRKYMAIVLQDVFLFSGTILENITMNDPSISEKEVMEACKYVGIHDFIMSLPKQYHNSVGERGSSLSTGQRQLIAFARVIVFNPSLLILDEATSNVDTESEMLIQKAIQKVLANRTAIIIAHRLSTIQNAKQIIVMDKGQIIEIGKHHSLLEMQGIYYKMQQFAQV
jgi:ATP-binding cassette subfamily B protein